MTNSGSCSLGMEGGTIIVFPQFGQLQVRPTKCNEARRRRRHDEQINETCSRIFSNSFIKQLGSGPQGGKLRARQLDGHYRLKLPQWVPLHGHTIFRENEKTFFSRVADNQHFSLSGGRMGGIESSRHPLSIHSS
jgi:hypothetical protein